jgi:hypothetical protein
MVDISIDDSHLHLRVRGVHQLFTLKRRISVRLENIVRVFFDADTFNNLHVGFRLPGTHIPGVLVAGTFFHRGRRDFWDVTDKEKAVIIELENEKYDRLIVEVADPLEVVALILAARDSSEPDGTASR